MSKATDMLDAAIEAEQVRIGQVAARLMRFVESGELSEEEMEDRLQRRGGRLEFLMREREKEAAKAVEKESQTL